MNSVQVPPCLPPSLPSVPEGAYLNPVWGQAGAGVQSPPNLGCWGVDFLSLRINSDFSQSGLLLNPMIPGWEEDCL